MKLRVDYISKKYINKSIADTFYKCIGIVNTFDKKYWHQYRRYYLKYR